MSELIGLMRSILKCKVRNPKTITVLVIQLFITHVYMKGLVACSVAYDYPCTPWVFPFYLSSSFVILITMLSVIYFFSDIPYMQYQNMYQIIRVGRIKWGLANVLCIVIEALLLVLVSVLLSIVCLQGRVEWSWDWGKLLHTISLTNASDTYEIYLDVSYDSMYRYSPVQLMMLTGGILLLVIIFMAFSMFALSLLFGRFTAVFMAGTMTAMIFLVERCHPSVARSISYVTPVSWLWVTKIGSKTNGYYIVPRLSYIVAFLSVFIAIFIALILKKYRSVEFEFYKED